MEDTNKFAKYNWYSAVYESGFSIIFQVVEINNGSPIFCRKDGIIVDTLPSGYTEIIFHGLSEPEYK